MREGEITKEPSETTETTQTTSYSRLVNLNLRNKPLSHLDKLPSPYKHFANKA